MAKQLTPKDIERSYQHGVNDKQLGTLIYRLWNQSAWLHLRWNEYVTLFGTNEARIRELNQAAPGFVRMVQDSWWEGILLHLCRLTDHRKDVLSVHRLTRTLRKVKSDPALLAEVELKLKMLEQAVTSVRNVRNRYLAHLNYQVALGAAPLPPISRDTVNTAIRALDDLLALIDQRVCLLQPTMHDHLSAIGGADNFLDIVKRGLQDRERQFGLHVDVM